MVNQQGKGQFQQLAVVIGDRVASRVKVESRNRPGRRVSVPSRLATLIRFSHGEWAMNIEYIQTWIIFYIQDLPSSIKVLIEARWHGNRRHFSPLLLSLFSGACPIKHWKGSKQSYSKVKAAVIAAVIGGGHFQLFNFLHVTKCSRCEYVDAVALRMILPIL